MEHTAKYTTGSFEEMQKIAGDFVRTLIPHEGGATIVGLSGDLGAGKTSFSQGIARDLGILESVVSPTFVIMKIYELGISNDEKQEDDTFVIHNSLFSHLIHIDAYRLDHSDELLHLGWKNIISNPKNLILLEWPERVKDIIPPHIQITFTHISPEVREVEII